MLLVSGGTASFRPYLEVRRDIFGTLVTPFDGNSLPEIGRWAADNGAFVRFEEAAFLAMLQKHQWARERCLFVAAPDVVGDHEATLEYFRTWGPRLMDLGWPVAFVAQDGCRADDVPWEGLAAVFIGGRSFRDEQRKGLRGRLDAEPYKLGRDAADVVTTAAQYGVWVHMGRVNTMRRIYYAAAIGCDSVDGSGFSKFSRAMLDRHAKHFRALSKQRRLTLSELRKQ